jgi:hypothetical protein
VRTCLWPLLLASATASADDLRLRFDEQPREPLLHLDLFDPAIADGTVADHAAVAFALGSRVRFAADGSWWQAGSNTATHGWRAGGELSYDLGAFRLGLATSLTRDGETSRRLLGLFAYRTFHLSRWMHAWIALGLTFEQTQDPRDAYQATTLGLSLGTTFR